MEARSPKVSSFKMIGFKEQPYRYPRTAALGKTNEQNVYYFFFFLSAAGGAICFLSLQFVSTLIVTISSCDDRRWV